MPKTSKLDYEKRLQIVQDWIIDDYPYHEIINKCVKKWGLSKRQAERYIADARDKWVDESQVKLDVKRVQRIESLKKNKRSLKREYIGTPEGIRAIHLIDKELIKLEGVAPTRQMIEAEVAKSQGKAADPLSPESNVLIIEALPPYEETHSFDTTDTEPTM